MTFKAFDKWCNDRMCDGHWGMHDAVLCTRACTYVLKFPFWKRENIWKNIDAAYNLSTIVNIINKKQKNLEGKL